MNEKEDLYKLEKALELFWKDFGKPVSVNAKHTCVNVNPKFIVGNRVNPEIAKKIIGVYLSQLTSDKVVKDEVAVTGDSLKIFDKGKLVLEVNSSRMIDSMSNGVTSEVGKELAKKQKKGGEGTYLESKDKASYTFGEIRKALVEFLMDYEKNDSKNLLKDAVLLLVK